MLSAKLKTLTLISMSLVLGACATAQKVKQIDHLDTVSENPRIIVMPPDIRYYLVTTSGIPEPHAEWTTAARENFSSAVGEYAEAIGADVKILDQSNLGETEVRYEELHSAVGFTVQDSYFGMNKLPTKGETFDWSLGPGVQELAEQHDADYALFVFYRDNQASGGRVAFAILVAAATQSYVGAGSEGGFASLVDLRTGEIVWFNNVTAGSGELRDPEGAKEAVAHLFKDMPASRDQ